MRSAHLSVVPAQSCEAQRGPAVELRGVGKTFTSRTGRVEVLRGLNFSLQDGEFLAIVGPSGSGKIGYLTQHDSLLPWRTVEQNIAVPLELRNIGRMEIATRVRDLIAQVGLEGFERHYPSQLSGGMRKRAMLARTLIYDPPVLLMDEPFGPLDAQLKLVLQAELLKLWSARRKTVVFVTHDIVEAITLADRVLVFSSRPCQIRLDEPIAIPRPREVHEVRFHPAFEEHYRRLWTALEPPARRST